MTIEAQAIDGFKAIAKREAEWLVALFPDYPNTTAYAIPASVEFCKKDFAGRTIFDASSELQRLTQRFNATHDQLLLMRRLGQRE